MTDAGTAGLAGVYDWNWVLAFLFVAFLSWPANYLVGLAFRSQMRNCAERVAHARTSPQAADITQINREYEAIFAHFDLATAARIGVLERILYAFGIMFGGAFAIISGWIVLKAFNSWLEGFEVRRKTEETALVLLGATQVGPDEVRRQIEEIKKAESGGAHVSRMVYYHLYLL